MCVKFSAENYMKYILWDMMTSKKIVVFWSKNVLCVSQRSLQQRLGVQARLGVRGGRGGMRGAPRGRGQYQRGRGAAVSYRGRGKSILESVAYHSSIFRHFIRLQTVMYSV